MPLAFTTGDTARSTYVDTITVQSVVQIASTESSIAQQHYGSGTELVKCRLSCKTEWPLSRGVASVIVVLTGLLGNLTVYEPVHP